MIHKKINIPYMRFKGFITIKTYYNPTSVNSQVNKFVKIIWYW